MCSMAEDHTKAEKHEFSFNYPVENTLAPIQVEGKNVTAETNYFAQASPIINVKIIQGKKVIMESAPAPGPKDTPIK